MKLRKLQLTDFRGARGAFDRKLKDKNYFVYAENGRGKSTIADAIEFLVTGDLDRFHREGCTLGSAVHVDADEAMIVVKLDDGNELTRTLKGDEPSPLRTGDGEEVALPSLPILRHATIDDFMDKTGGEKREALLQILDLDALNGFRSTLRKAAGLAKEKSKAARARSEEERAGLESMREGEDLLDRAQALAKTAEIEAPISSEEEIGNLELKLPPAQPDRLRPVNELVKALGEWRDDNSAEAWNAAVAKEGVQREQALAALLRQGEEILAEAWEEDACPLCESPQDRDALTASVKARAADLAESHRQLEEARRATTTRADAARRLAAALRALLTVAPADGWPEQAAIETARERLEAYERSLRTSLRELTAVPAGPDLGFDLSTIVPALRAAATPKESPALAALTSLHDLREQSKRLRKRQAEQAAAEAAHTAVKQMLEIADTAIKVAVEDALKPIQDLAARYFSILMVDDIYSDVELVYSARRSGQVEFSVVFAGHQPPLSPPQRIMSESQLNALGIALHDRQHHGRRQVAEVYWRGSSTKSRSGEPWCSMTSSMASTPLTGRVSYGCSRTNFPTGR